MTRTWFPHENRTLGDLRSLLHWFRSKHGPLYREWECGTLGLKDQPGVIPFRRLLKLLGGSERDVQLIDIDDVPVTTREVRAMFSMYRRMRRAEAREAHALRAAAHAEPTMPQDGGGL